jgi:hypothetical protein
MIVVCRTYSTIMPSTKVHRDDRVSSLCQALAYAIVIRSWIVRSCYRKPLRDATRPTVRQPIVPAPDRSQPLDTRRPTQKLDIHTCESLSASLTSSCPAVGEHRVHRRLFESSWHVRISYLRLSSTFVVLVFSSCWPQESVVESTSSPLLLSPPPPPCPVFLLRLVTPS